MRIVCGFCAQATSEAVCGNCRHDPLVPYQQRGLEPVAVPKPEAGRPSLDVAAVRHRLVDASNALRERGRSVTVEGLAELLDVTPRTVRRWREAVG